MRRLSLVFSPKVEPEPAQDLTESDLTVFEAVINGDIAGLSEIVETNPNCISIRDGNGFRPLQLAAKNGRSEIIQWLTRYKVNVDEIVSIGYSAVHIACEKGYLDCVMALKMAGAKLNEPTHPDEYRPIHLAARNGNSALVSLLIQAGCPAKVKDRYGKTPLQYAVDFGHDEVADLLAKTLKIAKPPVANVQKNAGKSKQKKEEEDRAKQETYKTLQESEESRKMSFLDVIRDENTGN